MAENSLGRVFPRPVVGWQAPRSLETDLALHALESATWEHDPELTRDHGHGAEPVDLTERLSSRDIPPSTGQDAPVKRPVLTSPHQRQRRLSDQEVSELVQLYHNGHLVKDLSERFGIHRVTVTAHLTRQQAKLRPRSPNKQQIQEAARLYEAGLSLAKVGNRMGFNGETVRRHLNQAGVRIRPRRGWSPK